MRGQWLLLRSGIVSVTLLAIVLVAVLPSAGAAQGGPAESPAPRDEPRAEKQQPQTAKPASKDPGVLSGAIEIVEEQPRKAWERLQSLWHFRIVDDGESPITVGMLIGAVILFFLGLFAARFLSALLGRRVFPRFGMDKGAAATFQTLAFYLLLLVFTIYALQWANIPLTVFTVAGGALAIGVGFGSQNIVNNFISGLILMAERPMKVGDVVEVEGTQGVVEQIGARSTRIRAGNNTHIIVPNSSFLEKDVLNWTLSDNLVRAELDVGVAYGSPVEKARDLIMRAIVENNRVLKKPAPEVLFIDFGDSALVFRGYLWLAIRELMDERRIKSEIRFHIDELFREARITIAFPQRDVHLDAAEPLRVRVLESSVEDGQA